MVDLTLAISLDGGTVKNAQLGYEHTLSMKSRSKTLYVDSCLDLVYTAQSRFVIQLNCFTFNGTYIERPLFSSRQPLGIASHQLQLALPATVNKYRSCALEFRVHTMKTGGLAAISSIAVFDGPCPPAGN